MIEQIDFHELLSDSAFVLFLEQEVKSRVKERLRARIYLQNFAMVMAIGIALTGLMVATIAYRRVEDARERLTEALIHQNEIHRALEKLQ